MKKIFLIIIIYCIFAPVSNVIYATEQTTQEELIQSQIQDMNINSIIDKAEKFEKEKFKLETENRNLRFNLNMFQQEVE